MASKKQLVQSEILAQATIAQPASGFVSFGSKTTGLYQRLGAGADEKLLVEADNLAPSILTKIKTVDGEGSGLDADLLDGKHLSQISYIQSPRDFADGTLIQTTIDYSQVNGAAFFLEIKGNSYSSAPPFDVKIQGYIYSSTIIAHAGIYTGYAMPIVNAFNYGGFLCFWFPRYSYWQGFSVFAGNVTGGGTSINLVTSITNSVKPANITKEVSITLVKVWHESNDGHGSGLDADLLDGYHGAVSATANTYALRDASADIACRLLRPNYTDQASISGAMAFRVNNSSDNYVRFCSDISAIKTYLQAASSKLVGSANIDNYLGDGLFEFDPVPTGTPPISSPNIRVLSIGRESRNTQMAFNYATDQAWFRRKTDSVWSGWCEFYHSGNLSTFFTALKTIDGHGTGLDADLLDGKHADEFALANIIVVQNAHGFAVGNAIKLSGSTWVKAKADSAANAGTVGLVSQVIDANSFKYITGGLLAGSYTSGANYFLSPDTAGLVFIQSDPEQWDIGNVREFIGTGTSAGLMIEIDLGIEIQEAIVPTSIWDLTGVDRTGWAEGKVLKFDVNGNLVVGIDIQGAEGTGITLASLSAVSPIYYNSATGAFSIATGYIVPTTGQKANYDLAYGWGNHANAGYLTAITKAMVEAVLTGVINTHTHNYDNYGNWNLVTEEPGSAQNIGSGHIVAFQNTECIKFSKVAAGNVAYMYATLRLDLLTAIVNPTTSHYIPIMSTGGAQSKITISQLQGLIGGGGGTSDHAALTNLSYDASGHTGFARLAGSSSQGFAASTLTCSSTATATNFILSDRRLKRKIAKLKSLDKFDKIKWHSFELKSEKGRQRCGVIAQELEEIAPEMVQENEDGTKMVNYIDLLVAKIARLEQRIEMLERKPKS